MNPESCITKPEGSGGPIVMRPHSSMLDLYHNDEKSHHRKRNTVFSNSEKADVDKDSSDPAGSNHTHSLSVKVEAGQAA